MELEERVRLVHLLVTREGVRLVPDLAGLDSVCLSQATTVPIIWRAGSCQARYGERKAVDDLAVSSPPAARSLSPVVLTPPVSPDRSGGLTPLAAAAKLKRQLTFVETELCQAQTQTETQTERADLAAVETQTEEREEREGKEAGCQTDWVRDGSEATTQTVPLAQSQAEVQTEPLPAQEELIADTFPPSRSPRYPLTFSSTQTSPPPSPTNMRSQTSPQVTSPVLATIEVSEAAADEIVARVLLEHAGAASESESRQSLTTPASSSSTISQASGSLFSVESGRATSYDNVTNRQDPGMKDLSRTVNYLDLSRLGNEGETPNSDEIWVTVEDDNKFLTSDTETYSVATDKVSDHSVLSTVKLCKLQSRTKLDCKFAAN